MSDRTGRKPLLIVSQMGTFVGFIVTAFAPSLWVLFLARAIDGATAGNLSLAQAYISDVTRPEDRAKSFGVIGIAFGLGFFIGPAISGFLAQYDYRYPIFAAAALSATSILATSLLLPSAKPGGAKPTGPGGQRLSLVQWGAYAAYFRQPMLGPRLWEFLCFAFSFAMFTSGLAAVRPAPAFSGTASPSDRSNSATSGPSRDSSASCCKVPTLGRLVKRFGERTLNRVGFGAYAAGYFLLAFCHSIPMLIFGHRGLLHRRAGPAHADQSHHPGGFARGAGRGPRPHPIAHLGSADRRPPAGGVSD